MNIEAILLLALTAIGTFWTVKEVKGTLSKNRDDKTDKEQDHEVAQARKIAELEGKMESAYRELNTKVQGLEKSVGEMKFSNATFEARLLGALDKLENKIDKLLMDFYTKKQNN